MICASCETELPAEARFCLHCGVKQEAASRCTACQTELPPEARFCFSCGQPVDQATPARVRTAPLGSVPRQATTPAPALPARSGLAADILAAAAGSTLTIPAGIHDLGHG